MCLNKGVSTILTSELQRLLSWTDHTRIVFLTGENGSGKTCAARHFISQMGEGKTDPIALYISSKRISSAYSKSKNIIEDCFHEDYAIDAVSINELKETQKWIIFIEADNANINLLDFADLDAKLVLLSRTRNLPFLDSYLSKDISSSSELVIQSLSHAQVMEFTKRCESQLSVSYSLGIIKGFVNYMISKHHLEKIFCNPRNLQLLIPILTDKTAIMLKDKYYYGESNGKTYIFDKSQASSDHALLLSELHTNMLDYRSQLLTNGKEKLARIVKKYKLNNDQVSTDAEWNTLLEQYNRLNQEIKYFQNLNHNSSKPGPINNLDSRRQSVEQKMEEYCARENFVSEHLSKLSDVELLSPEILDIFASCTKTNIRIWRHTGVSDEFSNCISHHYMEKNDLPTVDVIDDQTSHIKIIKRHNIISEQEFITILHIFFAKYMEIECSEIIKNNLHTDKLEVMTLIRKYNEDIAIDLCSEISKENKGSRSMQAIRNRFLHGNYKKWQYLSAPLEISSLSNPTIQFWHPIARDYFIAFSIIGLLLPLQDFGIYWLNVTALLDSFFNTTNFSNEKYVLKFCRLLLEEKENYLLPVRQFLNYKYPMEVYLKENIKAIFSETPNLLNICEHVEEDTSQQVKTNFTVTSEQWCVVFIQYNDMYSIVIESVIDEIYVIKEFNNRIKQWRIVPQLYFQKIMTVCSQVLFKKNLERTLVKNIEILLKDSKKDLNVTFVELLVIFETESIVLNSLKISQQTKDFLELNDCKMLVNYASFFADEWFTIATKFMTTQINIEEIRNSDSSDKNRFISTIHKLCSNIIKINIEQFLNVIQAIFVIKKRNFFK